MATGLPGTYTLPILEALNLRSSFRAMVQRGNCSTHNPSPAALSYCRDLLRVEGTDEIRYVGDLDADGRAPA